MDWYYEEMVNDEGYVDAFIFGKKRTLFLVLLDEDEEKKEKYIKHIEKEAGNEPVNLFVCVHKETLILNTPQELEEE